MCVLNEWPFAFFKKSSAIDIWQSPEKPVEIWQKWQSKFIDSFSDEFSFTGLSCTYEIEFLQKMFQVM